MAKKTTYSGFTGQQASVITAVLAGIGPLADSAGTATTVNTSSPVAAVSHIHSKMPLHS
ncbi:MAG: hypothetical protein JXA98_02880 [Methanosarcinaceae archaeon]|nr:hypothetical protein [Methanosarcinaceae archaeon]